MKQSLITILAYLMLGACSGQSGSEQSVEPGFVDPVKTQDGLEEPQFRQVLGNDDQYTVLYIKHHKVECEGYQVSLCFLVRQSPTEPWTLFYDEITGFDYQWGYDYQVQLQIPVSSTDLQLLNYNPEYELVAILDRGEYQAGAGFELAVRGGHEGLVSVADSLFTLHESVDVQCQSDGCATVQSLTTQGQTLTLQLQHIAPDAPLVLSYVPCADSPISFSDSCGWPSYDD